MSTAAATDTSTPRTRRLPRWGVPLVAALAGVLIWMIGSALVGDVAVRTAGALQPVGVGSVVVAGLLAGLAGWGARALIGRLVREPSRARTVWVVVSVAVLLVSLLGPLGAVGAGALALLVVEHLVVGAVVVLALR